METNLASGVYMVLNVAVMAFHGSAITITTRLGVQARTLRVEWEEVKI